MSELVIAQISDAHLYAGKDTEHFGANVYLNLDCVLKDIARRPEVNLIIFTGDLSQDHTDNSYLRFNELIALNASSYPVYYLAGNHDDVDQLRRLLTAQNICHDKMISMEQWQLFLLNSKTTTPAGEITEQELNWLASNLTEQQPALLFSHHHAIDVDYFIDRHGMAEKQRFWQFISTHKTIKALACGHVHRALTLYPDKKYRQIPLYTCPATSIQFDPEASTVKALSTLPGWRQFTLCDDGSVTSQIHIVS